MPVRPLKKPAEIISDEQILKTLRAAVLNQISDTAISKKAVEKIDATGLSSELKSIGEKLIQRQVKAKKKGVRGASMPKLTAKELAVVQRVSLSKATPKKLSKKIISGREIKSSINKTELVEVAKERVKTATTLGQTPRTIGSSIIEAGSKVKSAATNFSSTEADIKLLPKPTRWERVSFIFTRFSKLKFLLFLLIIFVSGCLSLFYVIYRVDWKNRNIATLVNFLNLPVAEINNHKISFKDFNKDLDALERFYSANPAEAVGGVTTPNREQIKQSILDRQIRVLLVRDELEKFNEKVSRDEIEGTFEEMKDAAGGEEALLKILNDLYGWSADDFIAKAIVPILEEEKLAVLISQDVQLNAGKEQLIRNIYNEIKAGRDFASLAKEYSEDSTAQLGGDLDWFTKGSFVPIFEEQVLRLKIGEVSEPFRTDFGWHIVTLTDQDEQEGTYRASHILIRYLSVNEFIEEKKKNVDLDVFIKLPPPV